MRPCIVCGKAIDLRGHTGLCRQCWKRSVDFNLAPEQAAYIAGLFDGEAHIAIRRGLPTKFNRRTTPAYSVVVEIALTEREALDYINGLLPDSKVIHRFTKGRRLPCFRLRILHRQAMRLLTLILPYLILKRKQVEYCLQLEALRAQYLVKENLYPIGKRGKQSAPEEFIRKAEDIYWLLRSIHLNKKPRSKRAVERFL